MARRKQSGSALLQSKEFVRLALAGVEHEIEQTRQRLATLQAYAAQLRGDRKGGVAAPPAASAAAKPGRRSNRLSPEARKALSERMSRKWAEFRKAKEQAAQKAGKKNSSKA